MHAESLEEIVRLPHAQRLEKLKSTNAPQWEFAQAELVEASHEIFAAEQQYFVENKPLPGSEEQRETIRKAGNALLLIASDLDAIPQNRLLGDYHALLKDSGDAHTNGQKIRAIEDLEQQNTRMLLEAAKVLLAVEAQALKDFAAAEPALTAASRQHIKTGISLIETATQSLGTPTQKKVY